MADVPTVEVELYVTIGVDAEELRTIPADDEGRVSLGTEFAKKRVTVAIVDVESDRLDDEELAAAYEDAAESAGDIVSEWNETSDEPWDGIDE